MVTLKTTSSALPHCPPISPLRPRAKDEISLWLTTGLRIWRKILALALSMAAVGLLPDVVMLSNITAVS